MKRAVKDAGIMVGGLAIGLFVGYLMAKKALEKKYNDISEREIASMKEMYERKAEKARSEANAALNEEVKRDICDRFIGQYEKKVSQMTKNEPAEARLVRNYASQKVQDEPLMNFGSDIIDAEAFVSDREMDKISLEYYETDEVLIEDGELCDIGSTIGFDALDHFGDTGEEDVVYVRNKRLGTDFEVIRNHGCWYDDGPQDG